MAFIPICAGAAGMEIIMYELDMKKNTYPGKLIVFEGIDGAGKSTLLNGTVEFLQRKNINIYVTKAPSDGMRQMPAFKVCYEGAQDAKSHRISPLAITVMASGDRLIIQDEEIIPALEMGTWVLIDRYQFTALTICDGQVIRDITQLFIEPDITFLASCSLELAKKRVQSRPLEANRLYDDDAVAHRKMAFEAIANFNEKFIKLIDTSRAPDVSVNEVLGYISNLVL